MSVRETFTRTTRMAAILGTLQDYGIEVEVGDDFAAYRRLRAGDAGDRPIYPMFDVCASYIDASNGLWIAGRDASGRLVHTQAVRRFDLGTATLGDHLSDHRQKYVTPGSVADPCAARFVADRCLQIISGRVCYHGDFWLEGLPRALQGGGAIGLLSRLAFELADLAWSPDYVFAFVSARNAMKGTPIRHGYFHSEPGRWIDGGGAVFSEEWLLWMGAADLAALRALPVEMRAPAAASDRPCAAARLNGCEVARPPAARPDATIRLV